MSECNQHATDYTNSFWGKTKRSSRAAKRGCFKRGGFPIWTCPSFFVLFCPFGTFPGIFLICSGIVRGFSRFVLFLFLGLLRAPTRNSPERVRDTIWTRPEKSGKHPGLETPRFSFSQVVSQEQRQRLVLPFSANDDTTYYTKKRLRELIGVVSVTLVTPESSCGMDCVNLECPMVCFF